ncbi:hypothetical protein ANN_20733 [Periplaneta americana]|uniref:Uncharacterized protein n=1 Tax=Periplaneta americana TaxID=6978 RepID=A0ABQ8SDE5_PERAM|nr:hypothetical protein ANN_20733 [Periplaneta americana]
MICCIVASDGPKGYTHQLAMSNALKCDMGIRRIIKYISRYVIRKVQDNTESLELNGLHQFLVYADDVNMLGEIHKRLGKTSEVKR